MLEKEGKKREEKKRCRRLIEGSKSSAAILMQSLHYLSSQVRHSPSRPVTHRLPKGLLENGKWMGRFYDAEALKDIDHALYLHEHNIDVASATHLSI